MAMKRKSIKLLDHERQMLIELYLRWRIPIDQFENRPEELSEFTAEWRRLSQRTDTAPDLIHYMRSLRKRGLWVRLEGASATPPALPEMTAEETEVLVNIFYEHVTMLASGSDVLAYDDEIGKLIAKEFLAATERYIPPYQLIAKLTALRKRGLLPKVSDQDVSGDDVGFDDIDEAVG
jgi:hypothetical protein